MRSVKHGLRGLVLIIKRRDNSFKVQSTPAILSRWYFCVYICVYTDTDCFKDNFIPYCTTPIRLGVSKQDDLSCCKYKKNYTNVSFFFIILESS